MANLGTFRLEVTPEVKAFVAAEIAKARGEFARLLAERDALREEVTELQKRIWDLEARLARYAG